MAIDLLSLTPHKVSRDLSGYITYIYGPGGAGKTTFGSQMPKPLLIAFEKGYNALPGVIAQDVTTWGEMKQVLKQLDKPEVKDLFKTIILGLSESILSMSGCRLLSGILASSNSITTSTFPSDSFNFL